MTPNARPYYVIQFGSDDSVFTIGTSSEFAQRQVRYGEILENLCPGTLMDIIIITKKKTVAIQVRNVTFRPLFINLRGLSKLKAWYQLYLTLEVLNRKRKIDVLTTQNVLNEAWVVLLFAKMRNCPVVGQIHFDLFSPHVIATKMKGWIGYIRYALTLKTLKYFSAVRVVGTRIGNEIVKRNLNRNVHVIPEVMDMVSRESLLAQSPRKNATVLYVGRLIEIKNVDLWIRIAELVLHSVPEAHFRIVGDGNQREYLESLADELGIRDKVEFVGYVSYAELPQMYQSATVFLMTSFYEGFGRVVAEALANRIPVVAPKITGVEDIVVHGQSGFLLPPSDLTGMAACVISLLRDPATAEEMGKWGEKYVKENFDPAEVAGRWMQLLIDTADHIDKKAV